MLQLMNLEETGLKLLTHDYFDKYTRNSDNTPVDNHMSIVSWDYGTNTSCRCAGYQTYLKIMLNDPSFNAF